MNGERRRKRVLRCLTISKWQSAKIERRQAVEATTTAALLNIAALRLRLKFAQDKSWHPSRSLFIQPLASFETRQSRRQLHLLVGRSAARSFVSANRRCFVATAATFTLHNTPRLLHFSLFCLMLLPSPSSSSFLSAAFSWLEAMSEKANDEAKRRRLA